MAKRCRDCKHEHDLVIDEFRACPFKKICAANNKNMYTRKWWVPIRDFFTALLWMIYTFFCPTAHSVREICGGRL